MSFDQVVNGVPLIFVVMGLVELIKAFGVQGKALIASSFGIGLVVGLLYQLSLGTPADYAGWFGAALFGLALGLVASKVYDAFGNAMLSKANVYRFEIIDFDEHPVGTVKDENGIHLPSGKFEECGSSEQEGVG